MKLPFPASRRLARAGRLIWACALLGTLSYASAQACPEREVEIEQEGLGVVRAASLEYEEEVAVLESACFETGQLRFDARVARAVEAGVDAQDVQLSGPGLQGRAQRASSEGTELRLFGVDLVLTLPSLVFGAVPLPPGQYALMADRADVLPEGGLRLGDAALTHLQTRDRYRLVDALLQGERLSAARAELVRIETTQLQARPTGQRRAKRTRSVPRSAQPRTRASREFICRHSPEHNPHGCSAAALRPRSAQFWNGHAADHCEGRHAG